MTTSPPVPTFTPGPAPAPMSASFALLSPPPLALAERDYNENGWVLDLWLIPDNALRFEISDMYRALAGLLARGPAVEDADLRTLAKWYEVFKMYLHQVKDAEEKLRPWVDKMLGDTVPEKFRDDHVYLLLKTNQITNAFDRIGRVKAKALLDELIVTLCDLASSIVKQCHRRERELAPMLAKKQYTADERTKIEREYYKEFFRSELFEMKDIIAISFAWMPKGKEKRELKAALARYASNHNKVVQMRQSIRFSVLDKKAGHRKVLQPLFLSEQKDKDDLKDDSDDECPLSP